jgi:hypothetical protein
VFQAREPRVNAAPVPSIHCPLCTGAIQQPLLLFPVVSRGDNMEGEVR